MGFILKLLHGPDSLDLQTGRYCVEESSFMPPTALRSVTYATAAVGSTAVTKERVNRSWRFSVNITAGTNASEAERGMRELQSFLGRAGGNVPLYIAYRNYNDYTYEPFFGLAGAFARYEIVYGTAEMGGPFKPTVDGGYILQVAVSLVIKPQAVFPAQPSGQATGGIFENYIGRADGKPKGTVIAEATTNKMTNPAFMNSTWNQDWTASVVIASENKNPDYILFGNTSAMIQNPTPAAGTHFTQSINVGNTSTHTISYYIKREDGGSVTTDTAKIWYGGTIGPDAVVAVGNGWYRVYADVTGVNAATATGVLLPGNTYTHYVDGFQIEQKDDPTPFCYGDLLDCTWAGTKNLSTSTRTAARLRYEYAEILNRITQYTIRIVWVPLVTNLRASIYLCEDSDDDLAVWLDSSERYNFQTSAAASIQSAAVTLTAQTAEILHITFDGDTATVYRNGASLVTGGPAENATLPTYLYVGSTDDATLQLNATIQGFATFQRTMSAAEVLADYNNVRYQVADGERLDPLPWLFTEDGDNVIDSEESSTLHTYGVVGGLMGDDVDVEARLTASATMTARGFTAGILPIDQRHFDKDILTSAGTQTLLFVDGTGAADTNANNNVRKEISLSTTETSMLASLTDAGHEGHLEYARSVTGFFAIKESTGNRTNVQVRLAVNRSADILDASTTLWRTISTYTDGYYAYITPELPVNLVTRILDGKPTLGFEIRVRRQAGAATETLYVSHAMFLIHYTEGRAIGIGATGTTDTAYLRGRTVHYALSTAATVIKSQRGMPRPLLVKGDVLNVLQLQGARDKDHTDQLAWSPTANITVTDFYTIPRFDIF